jgi:hypothetical protein
MFEYYLPSACLFSNSLLQGKGTAKFLFTQLFLSTVNTWDLLTQVNSNQISLFTATAELRILLSLPRWPLELLN